MRRLSRTIGALVLGTSLTPWIAGCGTKSSERDGGAVVANTMEQTALGEVGTLYRTFLDEAKRPPKNLKDLTKYGPAFPFGFDWLSRGDLVTYWGVDLKDSETATVLAYEKKAPAQGGYVLMQDGKTVKMMTPEEFKAAPKAGEPMKASS